MVETRGDSSGMQGKCKNKVWAIYQRKRVDRISGLPEDVLLHILSFITTRQAVQMSLLSKRWRHLWTFIPVLCFEDIGFSSFHVLGDFIEKVLIQRREDKNIRKLHFSSKNRMNKECVEDWIIDATRGRNIHEVVIETKFRHFGEFKLPGCLFACGSLQVLKLDVAYCTLKLPDEFRMSELKSLYMSGIYFEGYSLGRFISNCPFLEDLYLERCSFNSISISGEQLRKLSIINTRNAVRGDIKIQISAPNLRSIKYFPGCWQHCSLENLVSLVEADIIIEKQADGTGVIFEGISNVSTLTLTFTNDEDLNLLPELCGRLPMFKNLTTLKVNAWLINDHVQTIIYILQHCPNLNRLIINNERPDYPSGHKKKQPEFEDEVIALPKQKEQSPQFLLKLKEVEIKNIESNAIQMKLLNFFMSNSQNLRLSQ